MTRSTLADFPGAPEWATVSDEGWLLIGDQAWTLDDWHSWQRAAAWIPKHDPGVRHRPLDSLAVSERRRAEYLRSRSRQLGVPVDELAARRPWTRNRPEAGRCSTR